MDSVFLSEIPDAVGFSGLFENVYISGQSGDAPSRVLRRLRNAHRESWVLRYRLKDPFCTGKTRSNSNGRDVEGPELPRHTADHSYDCMFSHIIIQVPEIFVMVPRNSAND